VVADDNGEPAGPAGDEAEGWPGLESLPPEPPTEWGEAKAARFRWRPPPTLPAEPPLAAEPEPEPDPSPEPVRNRPWTGRTVVGLALLAVCALVLGSLALTRGDAESAATTTTTRTLTGTGTTAPSSSTAPAATTTTLPTTTTTKPPDDPLLDAAVAEMSDYVAKERGHPFIAPVKAVRLAPADFEAFMRSTVDPKQLRQLADWFRLMGLVKPGEDYVGHYLDQLAKGTAGVYQSRTRQVTFRGLPRTPVDDTERWILAHELTHALDDQYFPFDRPEVNDPTTEVSFGMNAVVEGNALRVALDWAIGHGVDDGARSAQPYGDIMDEQFSAQYDYGGELVRAVWRKGHEAAVDQLLQAPPVTSEQVIHLDKFEAHEPELDTPPPPADDPASSDGPPVGELLTRQMLTPVVGGARAAQAAAGWGGDRSVTWVQPGGLTCLRTRYVMDTPADLDELDNAFTEWVKKSRDRALRRDPDHLDVTSCAPVPPIAGVRPVD
jgi:hypothetical protein